MTVRARRRHQGGDARRFPALADELIALKPDVLIILKGPKPADLPMRQTTKFYFVVDTKTARDTTAYIPEDVLALDLCGHKTFFSARLGLLQFAKSCHVPDPVDRVQRLILAAEFVIAQEEQVSHSIPHVVTAIQRSIDLLKDAFFD